jgi:hypothetical protein
LQTERYIVSSCLITANRVYQNGKVIFESPGTAEAFLDSLYAHFEIAYPKFHKMDSLCKLGFLAAEILLKDRAPENKLSETGTGLVLSNANASLDVDLKYSKTIQAGASPALFVYTLPNIVIGEISIRHRFKGENAFFVFKQFDGNFMTEYVNGLFENNLIKSCICGWVDILQEEYRAMLYLIELDNPGNALHFTADHLNQLNQPENG